MNIQDPWAGAYEDYKAARDAGGPFDAANQVIDVAAKVISKRRSARDKARAFVGSTANAARRSKVGQQVEGAARQATQAIGSAAQNIGQNPMMQQAMGAMQNLPGGPDLPGGPVPYAVAAGALGTAGALALRQKMKQDKERRNAMAAQMASPISY